MQAGTALLQLASGLRHILRDGIAWGEESFEFKVYSLQFIVYNLYSGDFVDLL